jgi:hypothetical protein
MRTGDDAEFVRLHHLHAAVGGQPNIVEHEAAHGRCSVIAIGQWSEALGRSQPIRG